jgi:hypothetical protein
VARGSPARHRVDIRAARRDHPLRGLTFAAILQTGAATLAVVIARFAVAIGLGLAETR